MSEKTDYWCECIAIAAEEISLTLTNEQLDALARAALAAPAASQEQPSDHDIALIWDQSTDEVDVPELRIQGDLLPLILAHSRALLSRYGAAPQPAPQDAPAKSIQWTEEAIVAAMEASVAGRRAGLDGKRSGLFFRVLDIADDSGAQRLFLENVSGIASATASVVDAEEGDLEERAAARVLGELADRGWDAEWITLSASEVGASHGRARWFCYAWRMADPKCPKRGPQCAARACGQQGNDRDGRETHGGAGISDQALADTNEQPSGYFMQSRCCHSCDEKWSCEAGLVKFCCLPMAHPNSPRPEECGGEARL